MDVEVVSVVGGCGVGWFDRFKAPPSAPGFAPSATPRDIVQRLNAEMVKAVNAPDVQQKLRERGMTPQPMSLEEFAAFWRSEREKFAAIVKKANIKVEQ